MCRRLVILIIVISLILSGAQPAAASSLFSGPDKKFNLAMFSVGVFGFSTMAYYIYKNSPGQRAKGYQEELGPGEWYLAAHTGLSYLPSADWTIIQSGSGPPIKGRVAKNIVYQPGIQGGIKFGRFFDTLPWFGMEAETNLSNNVIRGNQGRFSPPLPSGQTNLFVGADSFLIWTMQMSFLVRCGFLKDKEVTFGRLQPYVGLGPGFEVVYARSDSAKNFAIEAQAGIRYMVTPNIALFGEYKFSYQFDVEYQGLLIGKNPGSSASLSFDLPHHRFVLGASYHFKNLYGE